MTVRAGTLALPADGFENAVSIDRVIEELSRREVSGNRDDTHNTRELSLTYENATKDNHNNQFPRQNNSPCYRERSHEICRWMVRVP